MRLHAACLAIGGGGLVIPGDSYSGKTTIASALLRCGASYLSDEFAVLDSDGQVHPHNTELSIRDESGQQSPVAAASLGSLAKNAVPVTRVALLRFERGARFNVRSLTVGEAMLELTQHAVDVRQQTAETMAAIRVIAQRAQVIQGVRGEATEAAQALVSWMSEPGVPVSASAP